jgi:hypothetical protein
MAKKTRAQKKRLDERKVNQPIAPYSEAAPTRLLTGDLTISGLTLDTKEIATKKAVALSTHPYLRKDLIKVGVLAIGAIVLELASSYAVTHGVLSQWGIS